MPYFDKFVSLNMSVLHSSFKMWIPPNFTTANFGHSVSKSYLRPLGGGGGGGGGGGVGLQLS